MILLEQYAQEQKQDCSFQLLFKISGGQKLEIDFCFQVVVL